MFRSFKLLLNSVENRLANFPIPVPPPHFTYLSIAPVFWIGISDFSAGSPVYCFVVTCRFFGDKAFSLDKCTQLPLQFDRMGVAEITL